jgi:hypothetical protein
LFALYTFPGLGTGRAVQTGIKKIKIVSDDPGKQSKDQYGGDPSKDVGSPLPPVVNQRPIHVSISAFHGLGFNLITLAQSQSLLIYRLDDEFNLLARM